MDSMHPKITKRRGTEIILGQVSRIIGAGGFLHFAERTLHSITRSLRPVPIEYHGAESFRRFLKFNIAAVLLLSVFSAQIAWATSDGQVMGDGQVEKKGVEIHAVKTDIATPAKATHQSEGSSRTSIVSESKGIKKKSSTNLSIKISTHEGLISLEARDADLREVLDVLSRATGVQINHGDLEKASPVRISVSFKNLPFDKAIKTVTNQLPAGGYTLFEESGEAKRVFVITKKGQDYAKTPVDTDKGKTGMECSLKAHRRAQENRLQGRARWCAGLTPSPRLPSRLVTRPLVLQLSSGPREGQGPYLNVAMRGLFH